MNNKYEYKLLREEVASQDAFSQKTHERIADSIVSLIENEKGGTTIGLEGSWGSGKSTVISLMTAKLSDAKVFIFDAWAHEGDCLRRVFLEFLLTHITSLVCTKHLKGNCKWYQDKQKIIDRRLKITETRSHSSPTWMGILLAFTLFLSAIASSLDNVLKKIFYTEDTFFIIYFLLLSPVILALCNALRLIGKGEKVFSATSWSFIKSDAKDETINEVSEEEERSSIEFERFFTEIIERVSQDNPDEKFVFAIDNLDRVAPQDALTLWSTLQTFFQKRSHNLHEAKDWFERLWVIVPYDAKGLAQIWDSTAGKKNQNSQIAKSFFDKCFQVRFEVPAPVMTEWENFTKICIDSACKNWLEQDKTVLLDVLRFTRADLTTVPTPREIKTYINQVCVLRAAANENVSTESICYYVLTRFVNHNSIAVSDVREGLIVGSYPDAQHKPYLPQNCSAEFSGLIFGVSPEIGQQILLEPEIQRALDSNNGNMLKMLSETHTNGFWYIFDHISTYRDLWKDEKAYDRFLTNCSCVVRSGIEIEKSSKFLSKAKSYIGLLNKLPQDTQSILWPTMEEKVSELIDAIKLNSNNPELLREFFKSLLKACNQKIENEEKFVNDSLWHNLQKIVNAFPENIRSVVKFSSFDTDKLLEFCQGKNDFCLAQWIKPPQEISNAFSSLVPAGASVREGTTEFFRYVLRADVLQNYDWNDFISICCKHIIHNQGISNGNSHSTSVLDLLLIVLSNIESVESNIAKLLENYAFYRYIGNQDQEERSKKAMLLCAAIQPERLFLRNIEKQYSDANTWFSQVRDSWKNSDTGKAKEILDEACKFGLEGKVWAMGKHTQNLLFGDIVEIALSADDYHGVFTEHACIVLLQDYRKFLKANNIPESERKIQKLLEYLDTEWGIEEYMGEKEDILLEEYADDYLYVLSTEFGTEKLQTAIGNECKRLKKDQVIAALKNNCSALLSLVVLLHEKDKSFAMAHEFYSALQDICNVADENAAQIERMWLSQTGMAELLKNILPVLGEYRNEFVNNVTDRFCNENVCNSDNYWQLYRSLFDTKRISNEFLNKMAWEAIHEKQTVKLKKVADLVTAKSEWQADPEYKKLIENALLTWYYDADDEAKRDLKVIADKFQISISDEKAEKEEKKK